MKLLRQIDQTARAQDDKVKEVTVRIAGNHESVLVMASDGTLAADIRPLVRLDVSVIVGTTVAASAVMLEAVVVVAWSR